MAEGEGGEPSKGNEPLSVFKTGAFNRSAPPSCAFGCCGESTIQPVIAKKTVRNNSNLFDPIFKLSWLTWHHL